MFPVEVHIAVGVDALEHKFGMEREPLFRNGELPAIPPLFFLNPLAEFGVLAKEGFRDSSCPKEIKVHLPGNQGFQGVRRSVIRVVRLLLYPFTVR